MKHYTYFLIDPRDDTVFYVGKGVGSRMRQHQSKSIKGNHYNQHLQRKILKILSHDMKPITEKIFEHNDEWPALAVEIMAIEFFGLNNLCNQTLGGDSAEHLLSWVAANPELAQEIAVSNLKAADAWRESHPNEALEMDLTNLEKARPAYKVWAEENPEIAQGFAAAASSFATKWRDDNPQAWRAVRDMLIKSVRESGPRKNNVSTYRGVSWHGAHGVVKGGWRALIHVDNKPVEQGEFIIKEEAAIAYDKAALRNFGAEAYLNFPLFSSLHYFWYGNDSISPPIQHTKGPLSTNTSGFKGVCRFRNKWVAQITIGGGLRHLGCFVLKEDAARAYDKAARQCFGPHAYQNFPEESLKTVNETQSEQAA